MKKSILRYKLVISLLCLIVTVLAGSQIYFSGWLFSSSLSKSQLAQVSQETSAGKIYYVATVGSDSNSGTASAPFRTIQKGVNVAQPGDTILVMNGLYEPTGCSSAESGFAVTINKAGTSGARITLKSENKRGAVLDAKSLCHSYINFGSSAAFWTIQDFEIKNGYHGGIWSNSGADNVIIKGNLIHDIGRHYYDSILGQPGIYTDAGGVNWTFDGNEFYNIGRTGSADTYKFHDHALYLHSQNTLVTNNIFRISGPATGNFIDGWGVHTAASFAGTIANNTFYGSLPYLNKEGQIMLWDVNGAVNIQNNIFYNPRGTAITTYDWRPTSCFISNNIVYGATMGVSSLCTESNNTTTDPKFVNVSSDFHLQSSSPAINAGIVVSGIPIDIDGTLRPQGSSFEIGAYEFITSATPPPPSPPPTPTPTSTPPTSSDSSCKLSSKSWQNQSFVIQAGRFRAEFDVTPNVAGIDGVVGLSQSSATAYTDNAGLVWFNTQGHIQAFNGQTNGYTASTSINYTSGTIYHFRLEVDVPNKIYSAYVKPQGGSEITIGTNYTFRSQATGLAYLNFISSVAGSGGDMNICNFSFTATSDATSPPTPTGSTYKFIIKDRVYTTDKIKVRFTPTTKGGALCTQSRNAHGTIMGGPKIANGYTWWQVNYDSSCDGWSVENWLSK
jgi:hypothetical protein